MKRQIAVDSVMALPTLQFYMPEWIAAYFVSQGAGMEKTPNELTLKVTITKYRPTRAFSGSHIITNKPKQFV